MKIPLAILAATLLGIGLAAGADQHKGHAAAGVPADYPLKTCPISGDSLGDHGKPVKVTHEGIDVYLCCKKCIKDFNKDPAKYAKMVKDARK